MLQTLEHLFHHCTQRKEQQKGLWKTAEEATGWKGTRFRHVQISELFSMEQCDQLVMNIVAATDVGKFPPKVVEVPMQEERRKD